MDVTRRAGGDEDAEVTRYAPAAPAPRIQFESGDTMACPAFGLVGRRPSVEPHDPPDAQLIPLVDGERLLSRTHLALGYDSEGAWILDRQSSNGTVIHTPDGRSATATPGEKVRVAPGAVVTAGGVSFTVIAPQG